MYVLVELAFAYQTIMVALSAKLTKATTRVHTRCHLPAYLHSIFIGALPQIKKSVWNNTVEKQRCRDRVINDFLSWSRHLLVPLLFHEVTSLHPPSYQRNDFSTCSDVHMRVNVRRGKASKLFPPYFLRVRASSCTLELLLLVFSGLLVCGKQLYTRSVHVMHSSAGAVPFVHFTRDKRLSRSSN